MADAAKTAEIFGLSRTISRRKIFHWKHKSRDAKNYVRRCIPCQEKKDYIGNEFTDSSSLEFP